LPEEKMSFQFHALPADQFQPLFALSDIALKKIRASRMVVDEKPGYPCRVSLVDADPGETVVLVNFEHQPADSPFRSAHAVFVRENATQVFPENGKVPDLFDSRIISIRAFDHRHYIINAEIVDGSQLRETIPAILKNSKVDYLHLHNAKPGCFLARVTRA
jgi:hypothetical protein